MSTPLPGQATQPGDERNLTFKPSREPWVQLLTHVNDEFKKGRVVQIYKVEQLPESPTQYASQPEGWQHTDGDTLYRFRKRYRKTTTFAVNSSETREALHHSQLLLSPRGVPGTNQYDPKGGQDVYYLKEAIRVLYKGKWLTVPMNTGVTIRNFTSLSGGPNRVLGTKKPSRTYYIVACFFKTEEWDYEPCRNGLTANSFEHLPVQHTQSILRKQLNTDPIVVSAETLMPQERTTIPGAQSGHQIVTTTEEFD